jgi:cell wall-associated NlpC family hydrolase
VIKDSDYALPVPGALISANPSWLDANVTTAGTPVGAVKKFTPTPPPLSTTTTTPSSSTAGGTSATSTPATTTPTTTPPPPATTATTAVATSGSADPTTSTTATPPTTVAGTPAASAPTPATSATLPVPVGTTVAAVTAGTVTSVTPDAVTPSTTPTVPTAPTSSTTAPGSTTAGSGSTLILLGTDGATYTYTDVTGAPKVGATTTPGSSLGLAGATGITFGISVPDASAPVCANSALEAWSVGTPVNVGSLPTTCVPGDLSVITDGSVTGLKQNVLVVSDASSGATGTDLKGLLTGSQITSSTLTLDESQTPQAQGAAIEAAAVVTPAVPANPGSPAVAAVPATATSPAVAAVPAVPATPAVPAVTSNLIILSLGSATPAEAAALTALLPADQQILWVAPPAATGTPAPAPGTPTDAAAYLAVVAAHPNLRIDTLSSALALVTSGSAAAPAATWSSVGAQVVASMVAGYAATAYRLPNANADVSAVLSYAEAQLGRPYQWAGSGPSAFDCSGLVMDAFNQIGMSFTHNAAAQYEATKANPVAAADLQPGDLVFFGPNEAGIEHVGIYVGNNVFIDAPDTGSVVRFDTLGPGWDYFGATNPLASISTGTATTVGGAPSEATNGAALVGMAAADPNQTLARAIVDATWDDGQWVYLDELWERESGWNYQATNPTSGAYGIPQSLPADKMASVNADWATDPTTQILWGINYIQSRYGTPAAAWAHEVAFGWY